MIVWKIERDGMSHLMEHHHLLEMVAGDRECTRLVEAKRTFTLGFTTYRMMKAF